METLAMKQKMNFVGSSLWKLCLAFWIACCLAVIVAHPVWADDFHVNSTKDAVDVVPGDGTCETNVDNECTLRAAIQEANFAVNPDTITFDLPKGTYRLTIQNQSDESEENAATGDLDITSNISIVGRGPKNTIIEAADDLHDRVFEIIDDTDKFAVSFRKLTVRNGNTTDLLNAITQDGGGIRNGGGELEASDIAVISNTSPENGGGIMTIGTRSTTIERCTISDNKANGNNSQGGGISLGQNHSLTLINCTVSGNEASSHGGGINLSNNSDATILLNTTVANNRLLDDQEQGGGIFIGNGNDGISFLSSIIANNLGQGGVANDCYGQLDILDFSLVEHPLAANGCRVSGAGQNNSSFFGSADPKLGPLADNGGGLKTHALLEGSIAIDAGNQTDPDSTEFSCKSTDARGQERPSGPFCDMGSYEFEQLKYMYMPLLKR